MSFPRHRKIFPSDGGASLRADASTHRLDEFPAGYSLAGCSPALPASASPTGHHFALKSNCRSSNFQRTAYSVLTVCLSPGGHCNCVLSLLLTSLLQRELARKGESLSINRILEELGGIQETLIVYPRRQGQRKAPTATCLTRMNELQQRLFSLLDLQRFSPAAH